MNEFEVTMKRAKAIENAIQHFDWFLDDLNEIDGLTIKKIGLSTSSDDSLKDMREYLHAELEKVMSEHGISATTTSTK